MKIELLKYLPLFSGMDCKPLSFLAESSELKQFDKKQIIFFHGDRINFFYIIISGWVKSFRDTLDGQEALLDLQKVRDILGEADLDKEHHSFSAQAVCPSQMLLIPIKVFKDTIQHNHEFSIKIIKALNSQRSLLELQLEHASTMSAAQRVACFILRLTDSPSRPNFKAELPCDKNLIASYLNIKSETFSRALKQLARLGVKVKGTCVEVRDIQVLIKFCCVSCSLIFDSCKK
jgi:CRP/FNR family transcriptional regulator, dissimilatory nitrate respiration regulator